MKAVLVNSSDIFEYRIEMLREYLKKNGWEVQVIASDFMHMEKKKRVVHNEDYIVVDTIPYRRNISFKRLLSHYHFAKRAEKLLRHMAVDLLYIAVPANSQAQLAGACGKPEKVKVIVDIIDLWPESLPIGHTDRFPFTLWKNIRNHNLEYADYVITECDLYRRMLSGWLEEKAVKTIYWCHREKEETPVKCKADKSKQRLVLCYLGSINNIVDIPAIAALLDKLGMERRVMLKIIGGGEKKELLIKEALAAGAEIADYGKVYDKKRKQEIMDTCHYGLNIMKSSVCVGLSMKSVDYLEAGLPLLNNLFGDLSRIVDQYHCGINLSDTSLHKILTEAGNEKLRDGALKAYRSECSGSVFERKWAEVLRDLYGEGTIEPKGG